MKVVKLKYYDEFHCIGSKCRESCCMYWSINISKREYLNYKKADCSKELRSVVDSAFSRIKNPLNEYVYAKMKLKENGDCPFHDEDGLCMLQKELGEKSLSHTCSIFPRLISKVGNEAFICACDITCPHVVELLMNHPEGLEITEEDYDGKDKNLNSGLSSATNTNIDWSGYSYYWIIKNAEIDILQNRNFSIQERLLILGFFSKKADEYLKNSEGQKIEGLYNMMLDNEFCKKVADSLKAPQSDDSAALKSMNIFLRMADRVDRVKNIMHIKNLFDQVSQKLNLTIDEQNTDTISAKYNKEKYFNNIGIFRGIEAQRPYILENLLLNQAFISSPTEGIFRNYFTLVVFYNTLKICVPAFLKEGWTDNDLALAFTYAAKMILNTHLADKGTVISFIQTDSYDLPHAAFLVS